MTTDTNAGVTDGQTADPPQDQDQAQTTAPGGQSGGSGTPAPSPSETVSMTRAELDRQLADARRAAERQARDSQEVKELRQKARQYDELQEAQKTEAERLTKRAADAEALAAQRATKYETALKQAAFMVAAPEKGIPPDRVKAALRLADFGAVTVDEETDEVGGIAAVLDAVIAEHPFLVAADAQQRRPAPDINAGGGTQTPDPAARDAQMRRDFPAAFR